LASRPRALRQLGIIAEDFVSQKPGKIWARLTAYGQSENRIGFGDDIGISAGLASIMEQAHDEPCFVGDANQGGGAVIDLAMRDVLRYAMGDLSDDVVETAKTWQAIANEDNGPLYPMRKPRGVVKELGADNAVWL